MTTLWDCTTGQSVVQSSLHNGTACSRVLLARRRMGGMGHGAKLYRVKRRLPFRYCDVAGSWRMRTMSVAVRTGLHQLGKSLPTVPVVRTGAAYGTKPRARRDSMGSARAYVPSAPCRRHISWRLRYAEPRSGTARRRPSIDLSPAHVGARDDESANTVTVPSIRFRLSGVGGCVGHGNICAYCRRGRPARLGLLTRRSGSAPRPRGGDLGSFPRSNRLR